MSGQASLARRSLALLVTLSLSRLGDGYEPKGDAACPCLDFVDLRELNVENVTGVSYDVDAECLNAKTGSFCAPIYYGSNCSTHDSGLGGCLGTINDPKYCSGRFCYIDPEHCTTRYDMSKHFGPLLHYSYETCGNLNTFTVQNAFQYNSAKELRISFPAASSNGFSLVHVDEDTVTGSWPNFFETILIEAGVTTKRVPITQDSYDAFPKSSYSACVHSIALNKTDMCIGPFWRTASREMMSTFSVTVQNDDFYMVGRKEDEASILELMTNPFKPFTPDVWLGIFSMMMFLSALIFIVEDRFRFDRYESRSDMRREMFRYAYNGCLSFASASPTFSPSRTAAAIINIAYGIFLLVIISSYTANLASVLVTRSASTNFASFRDALENNAQVCMLQGIRDDLSNRFPALRQLGVPRSNTLDALEGIDQGACDVAIVSKINFLGAQAKAGQAHCDKVLVGDLLLSVTMSVPVQDTFQSYISYLVIEEQARGTFAKLDAEAQIAHLPANQCGEIETSRTDQKLNFRDMSGLFALTLFAAGAAIVFWLITEKQKVVTANNVTAKVSGNLSEISKKTTAILSPSGSYLRSFAKTGEKEEQEVLTPPQRSPEGPPEAFNILDGSPVITADVLGQIRYLLDNLEGASEPRTAPTTRSRGLVQRQKTRQSFNF